MNELSQFDLLLVQAITKSIQATEKLDQKPNHRYTQKERIGNFTTFLRREVISSVGGYLVGSEWDKEQLKQWLSRLTSTVYWLDVASPDYEWTKYYRTPFALTPSNRNTIMDGPKLKTLCDLAKERAQLPDTSEDDASIDNYQARLTKLIASANQKVAGANLLAQQVSTVLSNYHSTSKET